MSVASPRDEEPVKYVGAVKHLEKPPETAVVSGLEAYLKKEAERLGGTYAATFTGHYEEWMR